MINVQSSSGPPPLTRSNVTSLPVKLVHSIAPHVIELFKTLNDRQTRTSDAPRVTQPSQTQPLIEQLLRFAASPTQPSLAEQISRLVENTPEPLTDPALRNKVEQRLNQPSALNPQKTYAQLIQTLLDNPQRGASNTNRLVSRARRDLQNLESAPASRAAAIRAFADALVDRGDRQLASNVANSLIRQRLDSENRRSNNESDKVAVPADSTFGQAWGELADALNAEPFKSFAEARNIDISQLIIHPSGILRELRNNRVINFHPHNDADWAAASGAVLAAVKKLSGERADPIVFYGRTQASAYNIASFYGLQLGSISGNDTLFSIGQLLRDGTFTALSNTDELFAARYAPIKHQQREAGRYIAQAPTQRLNERLAEFAHAPAAQKVQEADQALARLCSHGLMKLVSGTGANEFPVMIKDIPEYSTFNQLRKQLAAVLTGDAFTAFAREKNLDPASIWINPVSGDLTGKVNNVDTTFTANDLSGWFEVWSQIKGAVQQWAGGSQADVTYPSPTVASLYDVMHFYNESIPSQQDTRQHDWRQRQLIALLTRSTQMTRNNGFQALLAETGSDTQGVKARQQSVVRQLTDAPLSPSPLEALAAAVEARPNIAVSPVDTHVETLENADSALAVTVHQALLELKADPGKATSKMIESIPANSLFGHWQAYLGKALKARGFTEWARKHNVELTSLRFDPSDKALIGTVNGVDQRFTAQDFAQKYPEHFDVLAPVLNAAEVFSAHGKTIKLVQPNNSAPLEWLSSFYGISNDPTSMAFARQTESMGRTQQFPKPPEHPERLLNWLNTQRTAVGNSNDRYALIGQLQSGIINRDETQNSMRFVVDPDSSHHPKGVKTARAFLTENGWKVPQWKAETDNLLLALRTPLPQSPPLGNLWGFLSTDISLSTEQRSAVVQHVKQGIGAEQSLLNYLSKAVPDLSTEPGQALEQLLSTDTALAFATTLQTAMKGAPTTTSLKQWLLTALVLEIDPAASTRRNEVAGFDFTRSENWGMNNEQIVEQFNQHLAGVENSEANLTSIAGHVLMAGMAPQFRVKNIPSSLTMGSPQWVAFVTAVNRIEQLAPGATVGADYAKIMDSHRIKPISRPEALRLVTAQMAPVLDWAAANNVIGPSANHVYTQAQLEQAFARLSTQTSQVSEATRFLRDVPPPQRRKMTVELLKKAFPHMPSEVKGLWREDGTLYGTVASPAEAYEAGQLGDTYKPANLIDKWMTSANKPAWEARDPNIPIQALHDRAAELPDVNEAFDAAIEKDYPVRRGHSIVMIKHLLSKLPQEDRRSLAFGRLEYFSVREADAGPWHNANPKQNKKGKKGSHGLIIRSTDNAGNVRDYGVYPDAGIVKRINGLPADIPLGGTNKAFGKIYDGKDEGAHTLPLDFAAFSSSAPPRDGVSTKVIVESITPKTQIDGELVSQSRATFGTPDQSVAPGYFDAELEDVATVCIDSHFLKKDEFKAINTGFNHLEKEDPGLAERLNALACMIPGVSSIEDVIRGDYDAATKDLLNDALSIIIPEGLARLGSMAARAFEGAASEIGRGLVQVAESGERQAIRDMTVASASRSFGATHRMQGGQLAEQSAGKFAQPADMAEGILRSGANEPVKLSAVRQDGSWYAYDAKAQTVYGPVLEGFVSDTSSTLRLETFSDGAQALVVDKPLAADAYTIPRANGFDLVNEGKVYRYDPSKPGLLTDLESADHFTPRDDFEAFCPAPSLPGRSRRGANDECFVKVINDVEGELTQELQALEHCRLYPSPGKSIFNRSRYTIFERRLYKVTESDVGARLTPTLETAPITYKPIISGEIINAPEFGFYGGLSSQAFEAETCVVKLGSISQICNDQREIRGLILSDMHGDKQLIIEADTNVFYRAKLTKPPQSTLFFVQCKFSPFDTDLVKKYRGKLTLRQSGTAGRPIDANLVSLPKLNTAYKNLEKSGFTKESIATLKDRCARMTAEQQREVAYQLLQHGAIETPVALKPGKALPLEIPENFSQRPLAAQNQFYAEQAKNSVRQALSATGLGPSNLVLSPSDLARADAAQEVILWLRNAYSKLPSNYGDLIIKSGAGNCGEMSILSADLINKSGGRAYRWEAGDAHALTIVGGPSTRPRPTIDFSEPEWADAWVVDPWANITCRASEYTKELRVVMNKWNESGLVIREGNNLKMSPLDDTWIDTLINKPKSPVKSAYQ